MSKDVLKHIGHAIAKRRKELGITQNELSNVLNGLSRENISNIEKGKNGTTFETFYKICCALDIQPSELFPKIIPAKRRIVIELNNQTFKNQQP